VIWLARGTNLKGGTNLKNGGTNHASLAVNDTRRGN
jgi:hypothetical protein